MDMLDPDEFELTPIEREALNIALEEDFDPELIDEPIWA